MQTERTDSYDFNGKRSRVEQSRVEQSRVEQSRVEQSRVEQSRCGGPVQQYLHLWFRMEGRTAGSSLPRASPALQQPHLQRDDGGVRYGNGDSDDDDDDSDGVSDGDSVSDDESDSDNDGDDDNNCKSRADEGRRSDEHIGLLESIIINKTIKRRKEM